MCPTEWAIAFGASAAANRKLPWICRAGESGEFYADEAPRAALGAARRVHARSPRVGVGGPASAYDTDLRTPLSYFDNSDHARACMPDRVRTRRGLRACPR